MKVEVAVLCSPSIIVLMVSVDVSGHHSPCEGSIILMLSSVKVSEAPSLPRLPDIIFTCAHQPGLQRVLSALFTHRKFCAPGNQQKHFKRAAYV